MKYIVRTVSVQYWPENESLEDALNRQAEEVGGEIIAVHNSGTSQTGSASNEVFTVIYKKS